MIALTCSFHYFNLVFSLTIEVLLAIFSMFLFLMSRRRLAWTLIIIKGRNNKKGRSLSLDANKVGAATQLTVLRLRYNYANFNCHDILNNLVIFHYTHGLERVWKNGFFHMDGWRILSSRVNVRTTWRCWYSTFLLHLFVNDMEITLSYVKRFSTFCLMWLFLVSSCCATW